ncbi:acyltransferase family protein [Acinetobacter ihumii]|uniref:acyltransferase family protein n=1 Tax=Acinetobacter ihumii TaxID=2483802 RepID=UPI00102F9D13|nr:acyltransferase family protein [Acinetobacter ihumii]
MRDSSLDKAKGLLIFLVVFGHVLERFIGWTTSSSALLTFIYSFHMPAFIFISGLLFKNKNLFEKAVFFTVLAVVFQFFYFCFESVWTIHQYWLGWIIKPYWILWYLWGMVAWSLLTPLLMKTHYPLLIAVCSSLAIGLSPWNNYLFSMGRIFVFLPFFVAGACYGKSLFGYFQTIRYPLCITLISLMVVLALLAWLQPHHYWLYGSLSYQQLQIDPVKGMLLRLLLLCIASCGIIALVSYASRLPNIFRGLGENTLAIYLLHGFLIILLAKLSMLPTQNPMLSVAWCLFISTLLCAILKAKVLSKIIQDTAMYITQLLIKAGHYFYKSFL